MISDSAQINPNDRMQINVYNILSECDIMNFIQNVEHYKYIFRQLNKNYVCVVANEWNTKYNEEERKKKGIGNCYEFDTHLLNRFEVTTTPCTQNTWLLFWSSNCFRKCSVRTQCLLSVWQWWLFNEISNGQFLFVGFSSRFFFFYFSLFEWSLWSSTIFFSFVFVRVRISGWYWIFLSLEFCAGWSWNRKSVIFLVFFFFGFCFPRILDRLF